MTVKKRLGRKIPAKFKADKKLSSNPGIMFRQALDDFQFLLTRPEAKFVSNLDAAWVSPVDGSKECYICVAGASLYRRYLKRERESGPTDVGSALADKLRAIDCFRQGDVNYGLKRLNLAMPYGVQIEHRVLNEFPEFDENPGADNSAFFTAAYALADAMSKIKFDRVTE